MLKTGLLLGSFFSLMSVVFGAFGAHALKDILDEYSLSIYNKAVLYQMFHSLGILIISILNNYLNNIDLSVVIWLFVFGIIIFSGSLYTLAVTKTKWLGIITPVGGSFFIIGWLILIFKLFKV